MIENELHKAIVAALKSNAALNAIINGRVYSETPPNNAFPFVFVGDMTVQSSQEDDIFTDIEVTIQAFSKSKSISEILTISGLVRETLNQELSVTGYQVAEFNHLQTSYPNAWTGEAATWQGMISFSYKLCATE
jgi:hypothetical protein